MALTKVTGQVIKNTTDVTVGVLTVTNTLAVGGTVSIGGTLTYEDVTNIDSVGLITARNGIVVGSGITLSKDGDIFATGVTTSTTFVGNLTGNVTGNVTGTLQTAAQTNITSVGSLSSLVVTGGITATGGNIVMNDSSGSSANRIKFGTSQDLSIYHDGSNSYIDEAGTGSLILRASPSVELRKGGGTEKMLYAEPDAQVELYYDNSKKLETTNTGVSITGKLETTTFISVAADNQDLKVGAGDDIKLFHDGTDSFIHGTAGTRYLKIRAAETRMVNEANSEIVARFIEDGAVELYHNGTKKFETASYGAVSYTHLRAHETDS